jgi:hypothetical protein
MMLPDSVVLSPDGKLIATASADKTVKVGWARSVPALGAAAQCTMPSTIAGVGHYNG